MIYFFFARKVYINYVGIPHHLGIPCPDQIPAEEYEFVMKKPKGFKNTLNMLTLLTYFT